MNRAISVGVAAMMCSLTLPMVAEAQTGRAGGTQRYTLSNGVSISGTVTGKSGVGLSNATVIAKNKETGFVATVNANSSGEFSFTNLPDGFYLVSALASSFDEPRIEQKQSGLTVSAKLKTIFMGSRSMRPFPGWSIPDIGPREPIVITPHTGPRGPIVITPRGNYL